MMSDNVLHNSSEVPNDNRIDDVLVSVIVCTYNQEKYISQALDSILCQKTDFKFEILVGDDASDDATSDIVRTYEKQYPGIVRAFCRKKNVGGCRNYYDMLIAARGEFLAACDGDDFWGEAERLQTDVNFLRTHSEYVAIVSDTMPVDKEGVPLPGNQVPINRKFWLYDGDVYSKADFEKWKMPGHWCALTSRNIYAGNSIDPSIFFEVSRNVSDRTTMLLLVLYGEIFCDHSRIGVNYRMLFGDNSENYMSMYEKKNMRDEEVRGLRLMEEWVQRNLGKRCNLNFVKKDRLASSAVLWLKNPSAANLRVIYRICKNSESPFSYFADVLRVVVMKLYYWYILGIDKRVVL